MGGGALFGSIGWRHAWGDIAPATHLAFASDPGVDFLVTGAPLAENAAEIEAGYSIDFNGITLTASYRGEIADESSDHGARVRLTWQF